MWKGGSKTHFLSVKGVSKTHFKCKRVSISDNPDQELHPFLYSFPMPIITQYNGTKSLFEVAFEIL